MCISRCLAGLGPPGEGEGRGARRRQPPTHRYGSNEFGNNEFLMISSPKLAHAAQKHARPSRPLCAATLCSWPPCAAPCGRAQPQQVALWKVVCDLRAVLTSVGEHLLASCFKQFVQVHAFLPGCFASRRLAGRCLAGRCLAGRCLAASAADFAGDGCCFVASAAGLAS